MAEVPTSSSWDVVKQHSRALSAGPLGKFTSPKETKFSKFQDSTAPIQLSLDGSDIVFENHMWRLASQDGEEYNSQLSKLRLENKSLQEENQLLKFKIDLLLDMLSTTKLDLLNIELEMNRRS